MPCLRAAWPWLPLRNHRGAPLHLETSHACQGLIVPRLWKVSRGLKGCAMLTPSCTIVLQSSPVEVILRDPDTCAAEGIM